MMLYFVLHGWVLLFLHNKILSMCYVRLLSTFYTKYSVTHLQMGQSFFFFFHIVMQYLQNVCEQFKVVATMNNSAQMLHCSSLSINSPTSFIALSLDVRETATLTSRLCSNVFFSVASDCTWDFNWKVKLQTTDKGTIKWNFKGDYMHCTPWVYSTQKGLLPMDIKQLKLKFRDRLSDLDISWYVASRRIWLDQSRGVFSA